ncbi:unnamed protein product [Lupinus luteus]|uniref:Uncharacterized protein n=1 Tax=Lupinus luteus TaxID=3873 RepID=A0AAV1XL72_LUPLU
MEVQLVEESNNPIVNQDMRVIGRLWADDTVEDEIDDEGAFTTVLSRSQLKKQKKKGKSEKVHNTRRGSYLTSNQ